MRARVTCVVGVLAACGGLHSAPAIPSGLVCDGLLTPSGTLAETLSAARAGDCVILPAGTYTGAFVVPEDVSLAGSEGAAVVLSGDGSKQPVLTIHGGPRSSVRNLKVATSAGDGIAIDPGPANLVGVTVTNAQENALSSTCTQPDCDQRGVTLEDVDLLSSASGLHVVGSAIDVTRGHVSQMSGPRLADGSGVIATQGAHLSLHGVAISDNAQIGVLVDGAMTQASLDDCTVTGNVGRGVWVQGVTDGGVSIARGLISANGLVGVGVRQSSAVTMTDVEVANTLLVPVPAGVGHNELVGDGVGLFSGASTVVLQGLNAHGNARAQILADQCGDGNQVLAPQVAAVDGGYRVVIQRTSSVVEVPAALVDRLDAGLVVESDAVPVAN
jgi:hypothetical protein